MPALVALQRPTTVSEVLTWHPHWDVWLLIAFLAFGYWYAGTRIGKYRVPEGTDPMPRRKAWIFYTGLAVLWIGSDWPIHDIGEGSLFTFHMIEHVMMALIAAPLLLAGTPEWMARMVLGARPVVAIVRPLARPLPAFFIFNLTLAGLHWPTIIRLMVTVEWVHFAVHALLFLSALLMWMPVVSPLPEAPRLGRPGQMMYLFANSLIPTVPASFLIFGKTPLYSVYVEAPKLWGWDPMVDQAIAGLIMKLGGGFILWGVITVIFYRWYREQRQWDALEAELRTSATSP